MHDFSSPAEGRCSFCAKDRLVISGICDACSYALREEWNEQKRLRIPALDPTITTTYVVIPRRLPSRAELDVTGYEFAIAAGIWPSTARLARPELVKWLRDTFKIVTWPDTFLRIYAGFDEHSRFVEVVLLTIWGHDYTRPGSSELKWGNFDGLLAPPTPRGAFVLGVRGGFEGFLLRRELAPATFLGCTVLSEPAVRFLAAKRHEDVDPVWGSQAMIDAYFKAMPPTEQQLVGQLLGTIQAEPKSSPLAAKSTVEGKQQELGFDGSHETEIEDAVFDEGEDEDEGNVVIGPLQPSEES